MGSLQYIDRTFTLKEDRTLLRSIACNKVFFEWLDISEETIRRVQNMIFDEVWDYGVNYIIKRDVAWILKWFAFWHHLPSNWYYSNGVYVPFRYRERWVAMELKQAQHEFAKKSIECLWIVTSTRKDNTASRWMLKKLWYTFSPIPKSDSLYCELKF